MTPATVPTVRAPGSSTTADRRETQTVIRTTIPSGWYDPDGAAWEADLPDPADAFRMTSLRPAILVEGAEGDSEN